LQAEWLRVDTGLARLHWHDIFVVCCATILGSFGAAVFDGGSQLERLNFER